MLSHLIALFAILGTLLAAPVQFAAAQEPAMTHMEASDPACNGACDDYCADNASCQQACAAMILPDPANQPQAVLQSLRHAALTMPPASSKAQPRAPPPRAAMQLH